MIYTVHIFNPKNNPIEAKLFPELAKEGLRDNTSGTEVCDELKPAGNDVFIKKTRYDAFFGTKLDSILKNNKIENVIITGTMTNLCCESTARTAMMKDYNVLFCSDLTYAEDKDFHKSALRSIKTNFGKVMESREIARLLS